MVSKGPIRGFNCSLVKSSFTLLVISANSSKSIRHWFLACEIVKGHSTRVMVDSLRGLGQMLLCCTQYFVWRSRIETCDMMVGGSDV